VRGITIIFNGEEIHTGDDLDLVQEKKEIGKPTIQSFTVEVPGRNGLLNLTKSLTGSVTYYNRSMSFQYFGTGTREDLLELDEIMSRFHGQTIRIIDDDHPNHYYEGEVSVGTEFHGNYITITLTVDAQPFRLKRTKTVYHRELTGTVTVYLDNESIDAVPIITVTAETAITYNAKTVTLSAGTYTIDDFVLRAGTNKVIISCTGGVTIEYQEGAI
jgi:phage-related protein